MIPVVALVGRPNVGKSTLFNRLTHTRDALVADFPGLTRDRKYGRAEVSGHEFIIIDTGGIDGTENGVETHMAEQSLMAIEEADIVLFMVDARAGLMPADEGIAQHLRSREKATFLVANKTDGIDPDVAIGDFYSLGFGEVYPIAASHGRGVAQLIEEALIPFVGVPEPEREQVTDTVEKFSVIKTLQAIEDSNVALLVIDAREGISDQDLSLLGFILNSGRSLVIVVNKWDGLSEDVKTQVKEMLDLRLGFVDFARIHFISALHGSGVGNLFESIQEAYDCATRRVSTSLLTRIMNMAQEDHQPPLVRGRRVKLKYAHAGGYNPPIVVIHGNQVKDLADSYKRYLMNYFRRSLKVMGTPIRIQFKEGDNPYAGKRNMLNPTQLRKRKRLLAHIKKSK